MKGKINMNNKIYLISNEKIMKEWNFEKNKEINIFPENITIGSHKKAFWTCSKCGFNWQAVIKERTKKNRPTGCPNCKRKRLSEYHETPIIGENDLESQLPKIAEEWNYEKNGDLKPSNVRVGSKKKVWWKCKNCGNEWQVAVHSRKNGTGCPKCSAKRTGKINAATDKGVNDLKTLYPNLIEEWNYEKNNDIFPEDFLPGSNQKVWWRCKYCGNEWIASIVNRTRGRGCAKCNKEHHISYPEKAVYYYVKKYYNDAVENVRLDILDGKEIDIYIPSLKIGIEYDGYTWHQDDNRDIIKDQLCKKNNITLIRLREPGLPDINSTAIIYLIKKLTNKTIDITSAIIWLLEYLNIPNIDVDIKRDNEKILEVMDLSRKNNSIIVEAPELVKEWNYEKNKGLNPEYFTKGSEKIVWWKCNKCGHEWRAMVKDRIRGTKCPICVRDKLKVGINDYRTMYPKLIEMWNYEKNNIKLEEVKKTQLKEKFWWKCNECGYEWQLSIRSKIVSTYCPKCADIKRVETRKEKYLKENKSFAENYPNLLKEWNYEKNINIDPFRLANNIKLKVWWKCEKGHEWEAAISNRVKGFGKCKICKK